MSPAAATLLFRWMCLAWLTVLGGCIGSFLNVVIYRLPRGESLSHPGSRCPHCGHAIRWYHNLPVLGWLALRGRCYDCQAPISIRYPLVEAVVAVTFFVLAATGPLSAEVVPREVADAEELAPEHFYWIAYGLETSLLCVLLAMALIDFDSTVAGQVRFPLSLPLAMMVIAAGLPVAVPSALFSMIPDSRGPAELPGRTAALVHVGSGMFAGAVCGGCIYWAARSTRRRLWRGLMPAVAGPYLGALALVNLFVGTLWIYMIPFLVRSRSASSEEESEEESSEEYSGDGLWPWPLLFWPGTFLAIYVAHTAPVAFASISAPPFWLQLAIVGSLIPVCFICGRLFGATVGK